MTREAQNSDTGGDHSRERKAGRPHERPTAAEQPASPEASFTEVERQRLLLEQRTRILPAGEQAALNDAVESMTSALPSARRDQQRNANLVGEARSSVIEGRSDAYDSYWYEDGKIVNGPGRDMEIGGKMFKDVQSPLFMALWKHGNEGHDAKETYDLLLDYGKSVKNNPEALKAFLNELIALLNEKYDEKQTHAGAGSNEEIIRQVMEGKSRIKNLICGPIAEFVVRFLNKIGVDAAVVTGNMLQPGGESTGHAVVMFKTAPGIYGFMGGRNQNFIVNAPNIDIALKNAFKVSPIMASSGYVTVTGVANGESYTRYMFNEEAAFGHNMDRYDDERVAGSSLEFVNSIQTLDAADRASVLQQMRNAKDTGLSLRSITVQGAQTTERQTSGAIKVTFEGVKGNSRRLVTFDTVVARDLQRMTALWRAVSRTFTETMSLSVERRSLGPTDSFDSSTSQGIRGQYEQAFRSGDATHVFAGTAAVNRLSGQSGTYLGQDKTSDFYSMMLSQDYRYVRTVLNDRNLRLNLWVGGGFHGTTTLSHAYIEGQPRSPLPSSGNASGPPEISKPPPPVKGGPGMTGQSESPASTAGSSGQSNEEADMDRLRSDTDLSSGGLDGTFQVHETVGGMVSGGSGRLQYFSALSFSLLHDQGTSDPSTQNSIIQTGYRINSATGFAYNIGRGAHLDGTVNFVNINTPVFDKEMAQYGIGVSVLDAAGVDGLDLRFDVGGESVREDLDISTLGSETLRRETSLSASGRMNLTDGRNVYGLGVTGTRVNDQVRGGVARTGQVKATYGILF